MKVNKAPVLNRLEKQYILGGLACDVCVRPMRAVRVEKKCDECPDNRFRTDVDLAIEAGSTKPLHLGC